MSKAKKRRKRRMHQYDYGYNLPWKTVVARTVDRGRTHPEFEVYRRMLRERRTAWYRFRGPPMLASDKILMGVGVSICGINLENTWIPRRRY